MPDARVLLVGVGDEAASDLENAGFDVDPVGSTEEATERLAEADAGRAGGRVECVVGRIDDVPGPGDGGVPGDAEIASELPEAIHERDPLLPVVLAGERPLAAVAEHLVDRDVAAYVHWDGDEGLPRELGSAIVEASGTYHRRLDHSRRTRNEPGSEDPAVGAAMLDSLLADVPMSIYFKDGLGRHVRVSDHITRGDPQGYIENDEGKVHHHPDDVIGKTDYDLYPPAFAESTYGDDVRVIDEGERIVGRIESGTTNLGEPYYTSTTKVPWRDEDGEVIGLVGVTMDVTERVTHREELERQNERLDEFAEVLTHDLRNPLTIATGYLDVLEDGRDEAALAEVENALERMETLVEEIRTFVVDGRLVEDPEAVDLRAVAEDAWSTVETGEATLAVVGDRCLRADRPRLRRLLENCFHNAVEHGTPAGDGADLTIGVVAGDHEFVVEDDGIGLPASAVEDVFERGFTTSDDGTGFGLAIVENIAEAHGWTVSAEESDDGGARFVFSGVVHAQGPSSIA